MKKVVSLLGGALLSAFSVVALEAKGAVQFIEAENPVTVATGVNGWIIIVVVGIGGYLYWRYRK